MLGFAPMTGVAGTAAGGGSANTSMFGSLTSLGLTSGLKLCLDAGDINSYASGQTWSDTSGNGTDFYRGSSSGSDASDPTYHGTPGNLSSNEYWSFDGGDFFSLVAASNPTAFNNLHKAGQQQTIIMWIYLGSIGVLRTLMDTLSVGGTVGAFFGMRTSNVLRWIITTSSASDNNDSVSSVGSTGWHMLGISIQNTVSTTVTFQIDGSSSTISNGLGITPSTASATHPLHIGSGGDGGAPLPSGDRLGIFSLFQGALLNGTQMTSIYTATKSRFGL